MTSSAKPPTVHIETYGCQMNEYDTELVRSLLRKAGFEFTEDRERADVILMNTCAIRENAHNKVFGHLSELKTIKEQRPLVVGVLGCMAQNLKSELTEKQPLVDVLAGPDAYRQLPELLTSALATQEQGLARRGLAVDLSEYETYDDILPERDGGINAWIAIMRGCDNFCSFCVVPYTRGRERSRDPQGIVREAEAAAAQGHKQITLLGQNVNSYRFDDWDFAKLILAVAEVPGIERVRFTSPHPKDFPENLLDAVAGHPNICKHIHLPLQSGSDRILEMMNRTYSRKDYLSLVERIRRRHPGIALTTDIICGFCSETEDEFMDTYRTVQEAQYHSAYIFKYSERKNTIAARKFPDDVPEEVKGERVSRLVDLQRPVTASFNRAVIGQTLPVMVEGDSKRSAEQWMGRTDTNVTVIWNKSDAPVSLGSLQPITIHDANAAVLLGRLERRAARI
ncbi:MAG: tRNA (N6-isopentenyl adenosine(37)-C2)-methylthiotransferase MiaB [Nitrospiraceae bacterium]|nr:tRNA (N6-isopentenyl adenosine(37)-C2)-methylthiotransferase MiaB [Nitrospiraceae bacterium]